jgi:plastocyanin
VLAIAAAAALLPVAVSSADGPTIESASAGAGFVWKPSSAEVGAGGAVGFRSASTTVPHGVVWKSGPETPTCSGVPIEEERTSWSGTCTFAQPGTYAFVCYVHPTEMKGTVTVAAAEAPPGGPPAPGQPPPASPPPGTGGSIESPLAGPASSALRLARRQHGTSVSGSIALSPAAVGGRLEVVLLAPRASLAGAGHRGPVRVGRLRRADVEAGRVSFTVRLRRAARRALRKDKRLFLQVRVLVTPLRGGAVILKRGVMLHV